LSAPTSFQADLKYLSLERLLKASRIAFLACSLGIFRYNIGTMKKIRFYKVLALLILAGAVLSFSGAGAEEPGPAPPIYVMRLSGAISPATAGFLESSIQTALTAGAQALLIEIDTPGGLGQSMRSMVQAIMNAPLPIIVYVSPSGAQAASAGVMVTLSADVAAMAPGTNIGAAHPVSAEGKDIEGDMAKKVLNDMVAFIQGIAKQKGRNIEWSEKAVKESISTPASKAVELGVVDLMADDRDELLERIDGRKINKAGREFILNTKGVRLVHLEETFRDRILKTLADPNIAYILMMLGLAGLYFELSHPGAILPGVLGGLFLILAFYSFQTLPVNYAGVLLILLGIILFILEIKVASFGMLTVSGLVSLTLGSLMLFKTPEEYMRVSLSVIIPMVAVIGGFFTVVTWLVIKAHARTSVTGDSGLISTKGPVKEWEANRGKVLVHGELWKALSQDQLTPGDEIEVLTVDGLTLTVKKTAGQLAKK